MKKILISAILAILISPLNATVYKWTDDDGRVHYGSEPHDSTVRESAETVAIKDRFAIKHVPQHDMIEWSRDDASRTFTLSAIELKLRHSNNGDVRIGGLTCRGSRDIYWSEGFVDIVEPAYGEAIAERARQAGYTAKSAIGSIPPPDALPVLARLKGIEMSICQSNTMQGLSHTATWVKVEWVVTDPIKGTETVSFTTEGSYEPMNGKMVKDGIDSSFAKAMQVAAQNLFSNPEFVALLEPVDIEAAPPSGDPIRIPMSYGHNNNDFHDQVEHLKDTTVIVKTKHGHGSGVIISPDGYVLTNAHVIGNFRNLTIKTSTRNYSAEVVRSDEVRDVALLKMNNYDNGQFALISATPPRIGSQLFIMGTPLDEAFSQTITSGVLSANRTVNGANYLQTDAAINRGNSGGPVFDESGEVVALTVAGHFTQSGANLSINYLIPISEAIDHLVIGPSDDIKIARSMIDKIGIPQVEASLHYVMDWLNRPAWNF